MGAFATKTRWLEHGKILLLTETKHLRLVKLAPFCEWEEARVGSLTPLP